MTISKDPLEPSVAHNEVVISDAEKNHHVDSRNIQNDIENFEERRIDLRTILAIAV
jgi:hypothetical protein